jgi:dolichyl-diphosphooligosaccharide--protein glycosyltransferase
MRRALAVAAAVAAGVAIRTAVVWAMTPDCVYHLRRARFALAHFPKTIVFDPLIRFPEGGICIWPPLFDLALALPARLAGGSTASAALLERTAAWVPIVFAAGAIAAAGLAATAVRRKWGWIAAAFVAVSPGHLQYSQLGHTDQHVAESFWGFLALGLFLHSRRRASAWFEWGAGLALAGAVLTWQGAIFWAPIFATGFLFSRRPAGPAAPLRVLGVPAVLSAAGVAYWTAGRPVPFTYVSFGYFQPVFLATCLAVALAAGACRRAAPLRATTAAMAAAALLPALATAGEFARMVAAGIAHLSSATVGSEIVRGGYLSYPRQWLSQIVEYHSLFADRWDWPFGLLSFGFFLAPVVFLFWAVRVRRGARPAQHAVLLGWGIFTFLFTLAQRRNVYYASLLAGVVAVELAAAAAARLARRLDDPRRLRAQAILAGVIALALALPMLVRLPVELSSNYEPPADLRAAMSQLSRLAPRQVDPYDPRFLTGEVVPEVASAQGVMAFWSQGHFVTYFSERPVVADNFGYGYMDSLRFFLAESEKEALAIARRHRVRWILTLDVLPVLEGYGRAMGRSGYTAEVSGAAFPLDRYYRTMQGRLVDLDGAGLAHFRLRWASPEAFIRNGRRAAKWKIFELVGIG